MFVSHYVKPVLVLISRKKKIFNISNELRSGFLLKRLCISTYFSEEKNFQYIKWAKVRFSFKKTLNRRYQWDEVAQNLKKLFRPGVLP